MKPHHRASLLLGCLGLLVLFLPAGLRVASRWPSRPGLGVAPALALLPANMPLLGGGSSPTAFGLLANPSMVQPLPSPQGPAPPVNLDDLAVERPADRYAGGQ